MTPAADARARADVRRSAPAAWRAWLTRGSREDRSADVGVLDVPALVLAGAEDPALGPDAQRRLNGPVYPRASYAVLAGARHLLPLERPAEVAAAIEHFWTEAAGRGPAPSPAYAALLASDRVSARTRAILAARAVADDPAYAPAALSPEQLTTLRAVADRVVPQDGPPVDLAARVDAQLARGEGDGWRFADQPPDREAYARGLDALAGLADLDETAQDARLVEVADDERLAPWFEDARADLVRAWLAHPATLESIGYDGMATGGDAGRLTGFQELAAGRREAWEPTVGEPA